MNKKILIAAANYWHSPYQVGSHQYAKQFSRHGYQIAFVSDAISLLHWLNRRARKELKERFDLWVKGGEWVQDKKIWTYVPFTLLPIYNKPGLRNRWVIENSFRFIVPPIKMMLKEKGFEKVEILWLKSIAQFYLLDLVDYKKSVFHIADYNAGFSKTSKNIVKKEKEIIKRVDMVTVSSRMLLKQIKKIRTENVFYIPNGVDFEHFYHSHQRMPEEYQKIQSPRVVYVGAIDQWFNIDLVAYIARNLPKVSFVLIGLSRVNLAKLEVIPNVYILGKRDHQILPQYLKNAHVGIIPFKRSKLVEFVHPIKLYEYMACGLPVVSTKWNEIKLLDSPALLTDSKEDFLKKLKKIIENSTNHKEIFYNFARQNTWEKSAEFLLTKFDTVNGF